MQRNLTDADIQELKRVLAETHHCSFTPDKVRALSDMADTALLVKNVSITSIVKGILTFIGVIIVIGVGAWVKGLMDG